MYGWGVFTLPARSPVGMPDASLLLPSLAGLFGIANLLDIYATTSTFRRNEKIGPCHLSARSWCRVSGRALPGPQWASCPV